MRVLALPRYARRGPSSRYRFYDLQAPLAAEGIELEIAPMLGDWYMDHLAGAGGLSPVKLVAAYLRQVARSVRYRRQDLLWIEKEVLPFVPFGIERHLLRGMPYVIDLDDNHFHRYHSHRSGLVRYFLADKLDCLVAGADGVTCGNDYLATRARAGGAKWVSHIPTVVDLARYPSRPPAPVEGRFVVGWVGTPGNARYLEALRETFTTLALEGPFTLRAIGAKPGLLAGLPVETPGWSEAGEVTALAGIDVGIMPLPDEPFERGKCGLKLLQYMASWKPTVASPVGVNGIIVQPGETGFLADQPAQWLAALRTLRDQPERGRDMGQRGRQVVEQSYTPAAIVSRLADFLRESAARRARADRGA